MTIERIPIQSREQWLALRASDITASDVPAVCGEGLFGSPAKVWAEKRGLIGAAEMTEAMKRGLWGEAAVFEAIAWEYPAWEIRRAKVYMRDPDARLGATPDGAAVDPDRKGVGIVQAKVISAGMFQDKWLESPDDKPHDAFAPATPPLAYQLQTLTEGMLANADWAVIAVLIVDAWRWTLRLFPVDRHPGAETMIRDRVAAFWRDYLDTGVQPPIDATRDAELVKKLFPQDDGSEIDLSGDNEMPLLVEQLTIARSVKKGAESDEKTAKTAITAKMGPAAVARLADGRRVSNKLTKRGAYSVGATEYRMLKVLGA